MGNFDDNFYDMYTIKVKDFGTLQWDEDWGKPDPHEDVTNKPGLKMRNDL